MDMVLNDMELGHDQHMQSSPMMHAQCIPSNWQDDVVSDQSTLHDKQRRSHQDTPVTSHIPP